MIALGQSYIDTLLYGGVKVVLNGVPSGLNGAPCEHGLWHGTLMVGSLMNPLWIVKSLGIHMAYVVDTVLYGEKNTSISLVRFDHWSGKNFAWQLKVKLQLLVKNMYITTVTFEDKLTNMKHVHFNVYINTSKNSEWWI